MKTKNIPAIVMLLGGTVACIFSYINHYDLKGMLVVLMISLLVFLVFGFIIKIILDSFDLPEDDLKVDDEGEVVEKQGEANSDEDNEGNEASEDTLFDEQES